MEKHKKCTVCRADAKWEWRGKCYCEDCMRTTLNVTSQDVPRVCEMCGTSIYSRYYTDDEDNLFCSAKCALEYNDACEIVEEQDNESGD